MERGCKSNTEECRSIGGATASDDPCLATCAAASITLRGRQPRLSAFAYYVNSVLQYGGAKKAVFNRGGMKLI
ncbi:hypothetical protein UPYG_G00176910 [Umbra pygmaea]|uniref:Uncharacterized protein n=1 Tax=Umbra pygmaea TaxID=75934 RepID=A0ABD0X6Q5_UMBPY